MKNALTSKRQGKCIQKSGGFNLHVLEYQTQTKKESQMESSPLFDLQLEKEALSACLNSSHSLIKAVADLSIEDFSDARHKLIFQSLIDLAKEGVEEIDVNKVAFGLKEALTQITIEYLFEIQSDRYGMQLEYLIPKLKVHTNLRKLSHLSRMILGEIDAASRDNGESILLKYSPLLYQLTLPDVLQQPLDISEYAKSKKAYDLALQTQQLRKNGQSIFKGHSTGFKDIDQKVLGLSPGHLIVIGGRPGQGKTSLMIHMIKSMRDLNVGLFSLEMTAEELGTKLLLSMAKVAYRNFWDGNLQDTDIHKIYAASQELEGYNLIIYDQSGIRPSDLRAMCKRQKEMSGLDIVFVDYLQLMSGDQRMYENNQVKVASISRSLKSLAKELNIPIVALAQVNRNPDKTQEKTPSIGDLRESGAIEADADQIWLLYHSDGQGKVKQEGVLTVIIGKNRFGEKGEVKIRWSPRLEEMGNLTRETKDENDELEKNLKGRHSS